MASVMFVQCTIYHSQFLVSWVAKDIATFKWLPALFSAVSLRR